MATGAGLIGEAYAVDFSRPLAGAADPAQVFATAGGGAPPGCMAVSVARGAPARARTLSALAGASLRNVLGPLAHGPARTPAGNTGYFVICPAPPGPSLLGQARAWPETELIEQLVKPAAQALAELQARGVTHRSIRPANLFQAEPGAPVTLGCAWAAPPASHQPSWIEPPYSATCLPAGRGDGTIADDIYALGGVLLMLALGANPVEGMAEEALLFRKLDLGSYAALVGSHRLPSGIAELLRGMLADDPDHRPSPALLATPDAARARRIAARPIRRAQRPIEVGRIAASTARTLAHALHVEPEAALSVLRTGLVDGWLRRGLGDAQVASQVEEAVRARDMQAAAGDGRADATLIAHAVALLDPAAPLVWRSVALWPDGLGAALDHMLHTSPERAASLAEVATPQVSEAWSQRRVSGRNAAVSRLSARDLRNLLAADRGGLPLRLCYGLNPLAPCDSPLLERSWPIRVADLLPAMELAAAARPPGGPPMVDPHIAAFISARRDELLHGDIGLLAGGALEDVLAQLRLVAGLQARLHPAALPHLCSWAADAAQGLIQDFRSQSRRTSLAATVATQAAAGYLSPIVTLLDDRSIRALDEQGCKAAVLRLREIDDMLASLASEGQRVADRTNRIGHDVASGFGAIACLLALALVAFA